MLKTITLSAAFMVAAAGVARAGGQEGSIGVGAEYQLSGVGGVSINYDAGAFHVGGLLGFDDNRDGIADNFEIGGRFYYHVHSTAMSDFGLGANLGIRSVDPGGTADRQTQIYIEPGLQTRVFLAANVALSFNAGVAIGVADADGVWIDGQGVGFNAGGGFHYYFF